MERKIKFLLISASVFFFSYFLSKKIESHIGVGFFFFGFFFLLFGSWSGITSGGSGATSWGSTTRWNRGEETHTFGDDVVNTFTVQFGEDFVEFVGFDVSANGFEDLGDLVFAWGRAGLGGEKVSSNVFHFLGYCCCWKFSEKFESRFNHGRGRQSSESVSST